MKSILTLLVFCFTSIPAFSHDYLFRVDAVGPNTAFTHGFTAPGTNRNVLQHVDGLSCGRRDGTEDIPPTAYVELNDRTGAMLVIRTRLELMARTQANPIVWRYDILPSPDDYDVAASLNQRINPTARINLNNGRTEASHMRAHAQQTWLAAAPIRGNRIMYAHAFTIFQGVVAEVPNMLRINPDYVERPVVRNERPLPIDTVVVGAAEPLLGRRVLATGHDHLVSACACGALRFGSRSTETADDGLCRSSIMMIREISNEKSFTTLSTPNGLDPTEHDDESDI